MSSFPLRLDHFFGEGLGGGSAPFGANLLARKWEVSVLPCVLDVMDGPFGLVWLRLFGFQAWYVWFWGFPTCPLDSLRLPVGILTGGGRVLRGGGTQVEVMIG
ncbi:hypothetical protein GOP47_0004792 [Adiantum capillus-veneris]|uniref:Uncharacterized protein n=1 Tax=Adiantum capillus-veneris TaxID=13818 RepID=A0A9D4ZKS7_ADICA|nr:hypothetical protein GOP47_0004792 [Adiantum capillus-veneris]